MLIGYDDGCHLDAYKKNPLRAQVSQEALTISRQPTIIDKTHLKGHTDPRCKKRFDPKKLPRMEKVNTQVAEQAFSWFSKFKHMGRYMNKEIYWVFVIVIFHARNVITVRRSQERMKRKKRRLIRKDKMIPP